MTRLALITPLALAACAMAPGSGGERPAPVYEGVETSLLEGDLVQFHVSMRGPRMVGDLDTYAECAAAQYALIRGYGFARHVRTTLTQAGGSRTADAVYLISPSLPRGLRTIDAEVVVADCAANGIPTV
ncbi:hypothetical protein PNH50_11185 [Leisingera aquaemixtae]|uniref:Lipoprotein n=1 Tax=Leisingera aquaemixtae TaxID=1396826 RepID=A0ABY5WFE0_9RHOB|nr:hypothetical protein [Leisingera aquaemixtae]UWQ23525.1 hypothetical protein K3553_11040 [Leisingera aquaemixtae]UWQ40165.1 hypothetical protein K3718_11350 [Leisingera aquaemixtae]